MMDPQIVITVTAGVGIFFIAVAIIAANETLSRYARSAVAGGYRVGLAVAETLEDEALRWLRSEDGAEFRKQMAVRAYDALPGTIGAIPVGMVKMVVSRDMFSSWVDRAFEEMADLVDGLVDEEEINQIATGEPK